MSTHLLEAAGLGRRLDIIGQASIPICRIRRPKPDGVFGEDSVIEKILNSVPLNEYALNAGNHALISLTNPLPHHPDGSQVLWIVEKSGNGINAWEGKVSWKKLKDDKEFLDAAQKYLVNRAELNKGPIYMYYGYYHGNGDQKIKYVYPQGMQTIFRPHFHSIPEFRDEHSDGPNLNLADPKLTSENLQKIAFFSNIAGLAAEKFFSEYMRDFSNDRITYQTPLKIKDSATSVSNNFYGFSSFEEALGQTLKLNENVEEKWRIFCQQLYRQAAYTQLPEVLQNKTEEILAFFKQSIVFNASFMFPSPQETQGHEYGNYPVWVAPFSLATVPELLKGVILDRKAQ